jgi:hypothetical protein
MEVTNRWSSIEETGMATSTGDQQIAEPDTALVARRRPADVGQFLRDAFEPSRSAPDEAE